jgi:hypothetical protein
VFGRNFQGSGRMSWFDILKRKRDLQKIPIAGSPVRGKHGHGKAKPRGTKRQQEKKEILEPELREYLGEEE